MKTYSLNLAEAASITSIRTLIVDDSLFMLKILAQTLDKAGWFFLVASATDAYQALRHVSALSPELVLMGIHMPGLNGIQAARFIKQSEHPPVVILFSSHNSSTTKSLAEQAGADGFVSKGRSLRHFRHRVIDALENLLGSGVRRSAASGVCFEAPLTGQPNHENDT